MRAARQPLGLAAKFPRQNILSQRSKLEALWRRLSRQPKILSAAKDLLLIYAILTQHAKTARTGDSGGSARKSASP